MELPVLVINLKCYGGSLEKEIEIADIVKEISKENIILCPQTINLHGICKKGVLVFSQHVDPIEKGAYTGHTSILSVKNSGAIGTLINHSEKRIPFYEIKKTINLCREHELKTIVCAKDPEEVKKIYSLKPDMIAVEPPELIGGDISVSTAKPEIITKSVKNSGNIPLLCGAGVKNKQDVKKAIELGAKGILVASGVVKSKNPKKSIIDLLEGFK